ALPPLTLSQGAKTKQDVNKAAVSAKPAAPSKKVAGGKKPKIAKKPNKAAAAAKAVKKGNKQRRPTNSHSSVHFYRPKTLRLERKPKYARRSAPGLPKLD